MRFELLVANQRDGLGPQILNGAQKLLNKVIVGLIGDTQSLAYHANPAQCHSTR